MAAVLNRATVGARMYEFQWTDSRHPSWLNDVYLDLDNHLVRMVGLHVSGTRSDSDWHGWCSGTPGSSDPITVQIHHRGNLGRRKIVHFIPRRGQWWSTNYPVTMQYQSYIDRAAARFTHSEDAGSDGSWILVARRWPATCVLCGSRYSVLQARFVLRTLVELIHTGALYRLFR